MKLLFPNGEHAPIELAEGKQRVGSSADSEIVITAPGVALQHCELITLGGHSSVVPCDTQAPTILNGKQIEGETQIKPGDLLLFARVGCRVVASSPLPETKPALVAASPPADSDSGRTRVRMALPKYLLRGVSGPTFGKTHGVVGSVTLGRSSECDVCIPISEISRHHARLEQSADGVVVEDLGSANGTFVNNKRVSAPTQMKPGDELRLDTVRFLLMSPGMEAPGAVAQKSAHGEAEVGRSNAMLWIAAIVAVLVVAAVGLLDYLGML